MTVQGELISVNGNMEVIFKEVHQQITLDDIFAVPDVPEAAAEELESEVAALLEELSSKAMSYAEGNFKSCPALKYQFHGMSDLTNVIYRIGTDKEVLLRKTERYERAASTIYKFVKEYREQ